VRLFSVCLFIKFAQKKACVNGTPHAAAKEIKSRSDKIHALSTGLDLKSDLKSLFYKNNVW